MRPQKILRSGYWEVAREQGPFYGLFVLVSAMSHATQYGKIEQC